MFKLSEHKPIFGFIIFNIGTVEQFLAMDFIKVNLDICSRTLLKG